jgi:hypothetical protein
MQTSILMRMNTSGIGFTSAGEFCLLCYFIRNVIKSLCE